MRATAEPATSRTPATAAAAKLDQQLLCDRAALPLLRAGSEAVGTGAEDRDEVAGLGPRQHHLVAENVVRGGQTASDGRLLVGRRAEPAGDCDGEVAAP